MEEQMQYWRDCAFRYRQQRDDALKTVNALQTILLKETGKAYDGNDYLREIQRTRTTGPSLFETIKNLVYRKKRCQEGLSQHHAINQKDF